MIASLPALSQSVPVQMRIGTSGFGYREWKGRFYPKKLPAAEMLSFYASKFASVEINNTFYGLPEPEVVRGWAGQVPPSFVFTLKAPQTLTHHRRLLDAADPLTEFFESARRLGPKLGPLLFQLPPNFKKDLPRLKTFLGLVPRRFRAAFEFRHPSWFEPDVLDLLRSRDVALCIADDEKLTAPWEVTASFGYLRLRQPGYDGRALSQWAKRVRTAPWDEVFVFFKHEDEARGPALAMRFEKLTAK